jgi:hypothetical protein
MIEAVRKGELYIHAKTERGPYQALQFCKIQIEGQWVPAVAYCLESEFNAGFLLRSPEPTIYVRSNEEFCQKFHRSPIRPPVNENAAQAAKSQQESPQ